MRLLLDTSSVLYRAFFALPTSITAPDGTPVNAVRGYLDMTTRLVADRGPDDVVHVFDDDWRPAPRVAAFPGYKSARTAEPDELPAQFTLLQTVLTAVGHTQVRAPGWEADDAIGALCVAATGDERLEVVTGDRDLLQLVRDPHVRVLFTVKGVSELAVFDEAAVAQRYGVPAARYVDFAMLRGDPSDGLPGVPGVGPKTAAELVTAYPDLDALLADARAQTPKLAERLAAAGEYLAAMRSVVPVASDVALETRESDRDDSALDTLGERYNLEGPIGRLRQVLDA